jgi:type I restriction enzyme S subunit
MANEWRATTWGDEISLEYGKALRGYSEKEGAYRVFGSNGPIGWHREAISEGPGVILGRKGAYRGVQYSRDPFFVIDTAYYVVPKTEIDLRWLYYAIIHHRLGDIDDGSPIPSTTRAAVYIRDLDVPPIEEQHAIALMLGTLDDRIELNQRMNETLEGMAQALYKSWFVDFEPVRAKADGRNPGLPAALADLFPDSLTESPLGKIPRTWGVEKLGDVLDLAYGKALKGENRHSGTVPVYGSNGQVGFHSEKLADGPGIIVGRKGNPGVVTWAPTDFFAIDTTFYVVTKSKCKSLYFLFYALKEQDLASLGADSAVPGLNRNMAYMSNQLSPSSAVLNAFDSHVRVLFDRIQKNNEQSLSLIGLRDTLLPRLISGELRLANVERIVGGQM